jgi:hypothetical protein
MIKQIARGIQVGYGVETCHPQGVYGSRTISQNFQLSRIFSHHGIVDHHPSGQKTKNCAGVPPVYTKFDTVLGRKTQICV